MYLPERDLIPLLLLKENWIQYGEYVDRKYLGDNYKELSFVYTALDAAHNATDDDLSLGDVQAMFFTKYPDSDKDVYTTLFDTIRDTKLNEAVGSSLLKDIKARKTALSLSESAFKFSTGVGSIDKVKEAFDSFQTVDINNGDDYVSEDTDLDKILDSAVLAPGLRWRLDCLNKSLGSLRPGDFGFLFKRPESGGTAFCASEVSHFIDQAKGPIIWFNNEEQSDKVILRVYQAYFGVDLATILARRNHFRALFRERVGDKFKMYGHDYSNKRAIEGIIKQDKPAFVVYDQLDGVKGFQADRNDLVLGEIYKWARGLAKAGHAALAITQADGTAEGQKWLTMAHVSEAKTTKQATADFIVGMGCTFAEGSEYSRYLNIAKNKLVGDEDTIQSLRHGKFEVLIQPATMRFQDIVKYN